MTDNAWCSDEYKCTDIKKLLKFLRHKDRKSVTVAATEVKTKEERIAKRLAEAKEDAEKKSQNRAEPSSHTPLEKQEYLLKICGCESNLSVVKMDPLSSNMTRRDAFILDAIRTMYVWLDIETNTFKRDKALHLATRLSIELDTPLKVVDRNRPNPSLEVEFWDNFGGKNTFIPAESPLSDEDLSRDSENFRLYRIEDDNDNGDCRTTEFDGRFISKDLLKSTSCVVLDDTRDVYLWKGSYTTNSCSSYASFKAENLMGTGNRPECCNIIYEVEGYERVLFIEHFPDWRDNLWNSTEQERREAMERKRRAEEEETRKETELFRSQGIFTTESTTSSRTRALPSPLPAGDWISDLAHTYTHTKTTLSFNNFSLNLTGQRTAKKKP